MGTLKIIGIFVVVYGLFSLMILGIQAWGVGS